MDRLVDTGTHTSKGGDMKVRCSGRRSACAAILAMLLPLQSFALGAPNLLIKQKPAAQGQGYVLFSIAYPHAKFPIEPPCINLDIVPAPTDGKRPKLQYLSTTTGLHCDAAWKDKKAVVRADGMVRVVILRLLPVGEYQLKRASLLFTGPVSVASGEISVEGFEAVRVSGDQISYAGSYQMLRAPGATDLEVKNFRAEDLAVMHELRPDLDALAVSGGNP
jgi:hypothetical protein